MTPLFSKSGDGFAERLRLWRVSQNFTQAEAARHLGIDRSYLSQVERGRRPGQTLRTRFSIVEKSSSVNAQGLRNLPVFSSMQASQIVDFSKIPQDCIEVVPSNVSDEQAFGVHLHGDSMEPKFSDGDIAIVLPGVTATHGENVLVNLKNQGVFSRILHVRSGKPLVKLTCYNPAYPHMEYLREEFHWIFPVATIVKHLR